MATRNHNLSKFDSPLPSAADMRFGIVVAEWNREVTEALLEAWLTEEPAEKSVYNKMTRYFTIHVANARCDLWSEHYGTELVIEIQTDADTGFFEQVMGQYPESFSIGEF